MNIDRTFRADGGDISQAIAKAETRGSLDTKSQMGLKVCILLPDNLRSCEWYARHGDFIDRKDAIR